MRNYSSLPLIKEIFKQAEIEAKFFEDNKIRPEHVLLALCADVECIELFHSMDFQSHEIHDMVCDFIRKNDLTPRLSVGPTMKVPLSKELTAAVKKLSDEASVLNDDTINTIHLLLCILTLKNPVFDMMKEVKLSYMTIKKAYKAHKDENKQSGRDFDDEEDDFPRQSKKKTDSKTPVLDNFCRDVSKAVANKQIDKVVGRAIEIKRCAQILSRRKKNNPILIGEPGVGKTAILEGLAQLIHDGDAPRPLANKTIYSLDLASIVAGTKYRGQFEERMKAVLEECKANPNIVLFIDELHTIVGAGNASGSLDASNIFKPALSRGEIQIIGATTLDEYRESIEKDGALTRRFQQVLVEEPTLEETKHILMNIKDKYEAFHKVRYTVEAIEECVKLADRYIMERSMPDKAIDVLDEAGAATNINNEKPDTIKALEQKKLELNARKLEVVQKQNFEDAAVIRDEEKLVFSELSDARKKWVDSLDKNITEVGVELISEVVSMMTGIPLTKISVEESKKLVNLDVELQKNLIGQDAAVTKVVKAIKRGRVGIKDKKKPVGSFIFLGPTGVGKTELAKLLAENVYGDVEALIRIDMSEYMDKFSVSKLTGPPPGYVGYEQGGQLTEKVRRKPHCVILFDEIEKAHEDVFNLLLQVLDDGHLTDGLGRRVNFKNTLIILTSNIGVSEMNSFGRNMGFQTAKSVMAEEERSRSIIEAALKKKFRPEFLNRIDEAIIFNSLKPEDIHKIIYCEIAKLEARLGEIGLKININKQAIEFIAEQGYDAVYGARPLNRAIQRHIEDKIADEILSGNVNDGDVIKITFDKATDTVVVKGSTPAKAK